jgi:predicted GIY-YIG superfamily endonuclease
MPSAFTDAADPFPHALYRLFAEDGTLLYIGVTRDVEHRLYMHRMTHFLPGSAIVRRRMHHHTEEWFETKLAARTAERRAIFEEAPLANRQHNPKRWRYVRGLGYQPVEQLPAAAEVAS